MIFTERVADDSGALAVGFVVIQPHFVHGEQNSPVHGFETVAHVGDRPRLVDRHGVGDKRAFELVVHLHIQHFGHGERFLKFLG